MSTAGERDRVLSGMRPTGRLHLGHYHGVLKNWARLQNEYDSFFFVADWHALTTHYEDSEIMAANVWFIIWPNQQKVIGLVEASDAEKPKAARAAGLASRVNTMLSIPMLYAMVAAQSLYG